MLVKISKCYETNLKCFLFLNFHEFSLGTSLISFQSSYPRYLIYPDLLRSRKHHQHVSLSSNKSVPFILAWIGHLVVPLDFLLLDSLESSHLISECPNDFICLTQITIKQIYRSLGHPYIFSQAWPQWETGEPINSRLIFASLF